MVIESVLDKTVPDLRDDDGSVTEANASMKLGQYLQNNLSFEEMGTLIATMETGEVK